MTQEEAHHGGGLTGKKHGTKGFQEECIFSKGVCVLCCLQAEENLFDHICSRNTEPLQDADITEDRAVLRLESPQFEEVLYFPNVA